MAKNRFGQFIPEGNGKATFEYAVLQKLEEICDLLSSSMASSQALLSDDENEDNSNSENVK